MSTPPEGSERKSWSRFVLAWAIVATLLSIVSTGVTVAVFLSTRRPDYGKEGWSRWTRAAGGNGHWYKAVLLPKGVTWEETSALAAQQGGYLATILSEGENNFVFGLVNAPEFFTADNGNGPALGGFQQD